MIQNFTDFNFYKKYTNNPITIIRSKIKAVMINLAFLDIIQELKK